MIENSNSETIARSTSKLKELFRIDFLTFTSQNNSFLADKFL